MSGLREKLPRERTVNALIIGAIIVCSSIIVISYTSPLPTPKVTLNVLSLYDVSVTNRIENSFLTSSYAIENNIDAIEWTNVYIESWYALVRSGSIDLILGPLETIDGFGGSGLLSPISEEITSKVNDTIAGVSMKGYSSSHTVWCSYAMNVVIFELFVNELVFQEYGLEIPETVEEMLSPQYFSNGINFSLLGMDHRVSGIDYDFQRMLTESFGWQNGIQNLTLLYANSHLFDIEEDAWDALVDGEIGAVLTAFYGSPWLEYSPSNIVRTRIEDMVAVLPRVVAISNETQYPLHSQVFVDFLLSPEGQSIWLDITGMVLPVRQVAFNTASQYDESLYAEFNWTSRTDGFGVSELNTREGRALGVYMECTAFLVHNNLTSCWSNIIMAYENGSIDELQYNHFRKELGELISIIDPYTLDNESFTRDYAWSIYYNLNTEAYAIDVTYFWTMNANERYERILNELSTLL